MYHGDHGLPCFSRRHASLVQYSVMKAYIHAASMSSRYIPDWSTYEDSVSAKEILTFGMGSPSNSNKDRSKCSANAFSGITWSNRTWRQRRQNLKKRLLFLLRPNIKEQSKPVF